MTHRHLEYAAETPAEELPLAAIVDILGRGDLRDWKPLADAITRDPYGALAERVARLVDAYPMYGTSPLWRAWIDRCRARAEGRRPLAEKPLDLAAVRRRAGLTQVELARRMGISQSDLSKLERRSDMRVSTLEEYVARVGARLHLHLEFPDEWVEARVADER